MKTSFMRFEKKFILNKIQMQSMIKGLFSNGFIYDTYAASSNTYPIYTIYYDTLDRNVLRQSSNKSAYREKFRLRFYTYPLKDDSIVFLEIKKKLAGKGNKRRLPLTYLNAMNYLEKKLEPHLIDSNHTQIFKEIDHFLNHNKVFPLTFISYQRTALIEDKLQMRITFDSDLSYQNLMNPNELLDTLMTYKNNDVVIMEIKSLSNYPLWLTKLLTNHRIYATNFSKYKKIYESLHEGEKITHVTN